MIGIQNNRFISSQTGAALRIALPGVRPAIAEPAAGLSPEEALAIAVDADIYGYSLVNTEVTRVEKLTGYRRRMRPSQPPCACAGHKPKHPLC